MDRIKEFYKQIDKYKENKFNGVGIFVYNDMNTYDNEDPHIEECYDGIFIQEVYDAFQSIFRDVILCPSEQSFIDLLPKLIKQRNVYVYTMAQKIDGYCRRALIPALCEYYGFTNINANTYTSVIGVNKQTTFTLLNKFKKYLPHTIYVSSDNITSLEKLLLNSSNKIIIKPDCESCCIDTKVFTKEKYLEIKEYCNTLLLKYNFVLIQDFKEGDEIGITILKYGNDYFALNPIKLEYNTDKYYLTNLDSRYNNFKLTPLNHMQELEKYAIKFARTLNFSGVSRFDFKVDSNNNFYLFDVSPNPTISRESSCNIAFINSFKTDNTGIYKFLALNSILLKPSFDTTEH